eukprot:248994_1
MAEDSSDDDEYEYDEDAYDGGGGGGDDDEYGSLDSIDDSDLEYTESESTTDSYVYPWPTSSDDSWADISSDEVIQKILLKLPTYDPPDENEGNELDNDEAKGYDEDLDDFISDHSDSFVERDEKLLNELRERATKYHETKGITENDYTQFMKEVDMDNLDDMDEEFLLDRYPMPMTSQVASTKFIPDLYLKDVELCEFYLYQNYEDEYDGDKSSESDHDDEKEKEDNKKQQGQLQADQQPPEEEEITAKTINNNDREEEEPKKGGENEND